MQNQTGLPLACPIATYTVRDKCAVSVVHISPFTPDLLANPIQVFFYALWSGTDE
jgi:hypothetical protein